MGAMDYLREHEEDLTYLGFDDREKCYVYSEHMGNNHHRIICVKGNEMQVLISFKGQEEKEMTI